MWYRKVICCNFKSIWNFKGLTPTKTIFTLLWTYLYVLVVSLDCFEEIKLCLYVSITQAKQRE